MQITFTIESAGQPSNTIQFPSERAVVQIIQGGVGVPNTGNWDTNTSTALLSVANDPNGYFADYPDLRAAVVADINAANAARVATAAQLKSALLVAYSASFDSPITAASVAPSSVSVPLGVVAPGEAAPPGPNPRPNPQPNPNTPAPPPAEEKLLGLPKNVVIGVAIGAGVLTLGGLVLLALGGPAPARASGKARRR